MPREAKRFLDVRYDVTGLSDEEIGELTVEAIVQAEPSDATDDDHQGHPGVPVEHELVEHEPASLREVAVELVAVHGADPQQIGSADGDEDDYGDLLTDACTRLGYDDDDDLEWQRFQEAAQHATATDMEEWLGQIVAKMDELEAVGAEVEASLADRCDHRRIRFGRVELCKLPAGHGDDGHEYERAGVMMLGARRVEVDFDTFHYTSKIVMELAANERIVSVEFGGQYRNVYVERELS